MAEAVCCGAPQPPGERASRIAWEWRILAALGDQP